ncbi:hypothetical protein SARC_13768 [Sphaeroforma arctica JP610]|uniref:SET domain-containing protein n=1 Tax=Sphaeroforma arctica JP610 TaxID=667725 RepID=A0A0L0FC69_9EUKA|nr:hypothetical protein SARC_13768 [Sphaeroforma arctica JP610]KNC73673.1 hypothetical protein SARC_13768 [Sphaeroforma arctica JP610]|eukprot:XP_014147575.1 hypothetical protein SARC_13768 [Sphaeroforma arctica JP610]
MSVLEESRLQYSAVEVRMTDGTGWGLFTSHAVRKGDMLLQELPLVVLDIKYDATPATQQKFQKTIQWASRWTAQGGPMNEYPKEFRKLMDDCVCECVQEIFNSQSGDVQRKWMALHDAKTPNDTVITASKLFYLNGLNSEKGRLLNGLECIILSTAPMSNGRWAARLTYDGKDLSVKKDSLKKKIPGNVASTNSFSVGGYDGVGQKLGLYEVLSRSNHSCEPGTSRSIDANGLAVLRAERAFSQGEQVYTRYIAGSLPYEARQSELRDKYGFDCGCQKCEAERRV